jgi:hypothetical protein
MGYTGEFYAELMSYDGSGGYPSPGEPLDGLFIGGLQGL